MKKRVSVAALAVSLGLTSGISLAANNNDLGGNFEKEILNLKDISYHEEEGVKFYPIRPILEKEGFKVIWGQADKSVEVQKGPRFTKIYLGKNAYSKNKMAARELSREPIVINGLTYVPVDFFEEILDYEITEEELTEPEKPVEVKFTGYVRRLGENSLLVSETKDNKLAFDELILNISDETEIVNNKGEKVKLEPGNKIEANISQQIAMSNPAQSFASKIVVIDKSVSFESKEDGKLTYPVFHGLDQKVNQLIEEKIKEIKEIEIYKDLDLDYEITSFDNILSIVFNGEFKLSPEDEDVKTMFDSLNIDLEKLETVDFTSFFKEDQASQAKLDEILREKVKEVYNEEYEAEGKGVYFKGKYVVVYYTPLSDSASQPNKLVIGLDQVEDILK